MTRQSGYKQCVHNLTQVYWPKKLHTIDPIVIPHAQEFAWVTDVVLLCKVSFCFVWNWFLSIIIEINKNVQEHIQEPRTYSINLFRSHFSSGAPIFHRNLWSYILWHCGFRYRSLWNHILHQSRRHLPERVSTSLMHDCEKWGHLCSIPHQSI